ncbi:MAG: hypothetical protein AAFY71_08760 [Bacteroidota bacterium]
MLLFLTVNDLPSGVYTSQVLDVVKLMEKETKIQLVCFVSWSRLKDARAYFKQHAPGAIALPIVAGLTRWKWNKPLISLIAKWKGTKTVIARGPLAARLALLAKIPFVCYDGRGAVKAEIEEFDVIKEPHLRTVFIESEQTSVLQAQHRVAVTQELVEYWRESYGYQKDQHTIIPCTLSGHFGEEVKPNKVAALKAQHGIKENDVVFCFSGGSAGWNSLKRTFSIFGPLLKQNPHYKIILLTKEQDYIHEFIQAHPDQVFRFWLKHHEVKEYLSMGDYGLLIREDKVTNNVASPVKFAEYLSLGMDILISDNVRDYAAFVATHRCGIIVSEGKKLSFGPLSPEKRKSNQYIANAYLSKESPFVRESYKELLQNIIG